MCAFVTEFQTFALPICRIGPASAPPRWAGRWRTRWHLLRQVVQMRVFLNAGGSCPSRHERRFTDNPPGIAMELPCHASRPAPQGAVGAFSPVRSEEHTSELQSLMRISYAVFCLKNKIS